MVDGVYESGVRSPEFGVNGRGGKKEIKGDMI